MVVFLVHNRIMIILLSLFVGVFIDHNVKNTLSHGKCADGKIEYCEVLKISQEEAKDRLHR